MNFDELSTDFESHRIEGWLHTGDHISVPLISQITDNLYVGGCIGGVELGDFFTYVFSMYKWEKYSTTPGTIHVEVEMYDSANVDVDAVMDYSLQVANAIQTGGNILVHCQAGINRSNLIATAALVRLGYTVSDAIDLLREKRSSLVLANQTFERWLRDELQDWLDANPVSMVE